MRAPRRGIPLLIGSILALSAPSPSSTSRVTEVVYEGTLELEAHFRKPGDTRRYNSIQRFLSDGAGAARLDWTTWAEGDSAGEPESYLVRGDRVFHREDPGQPWKSVTGTRALLANIQARAPWPRSLKPETPARAARLSWPRADPRLGDIEDEITYEYTGSSLVPAGLRLTLHERDQSWILQSRLRSLRSVAGADSLLEVPPRSEPAEDDVDGFTAFPRPIKIAFGLWMLDMDDLDARTLVAEFDRSVIVMEAAVGSANGERIVDVVTRHWPKKPIRYFFFSHHHPHYIGGLRAMVAAGATVITTPGNDSLVKAIANYRFTLAPDRLARATRPLRMRTFEGRFELKDATNHLVAVDIGARSDHTDEFVVFWFPRQKILFETEQGWVTVDGKLRASRRAEGFLKTLEEEGIRPARFVQSWPMRGNRAELTRAELDSLILARKR